MCCVRLTFKNGNADFTPPAPPPTVPSGFQTRNQVINTPQCTPIRDLGPFHGKLSSATVPSSPSYKDGTTPASIHQSVPPPPTTPLFIFVSKTNE